MNKVKKIVALSLVLSSVTGSITQTRDLGDYVVDAAVLAVGAVGCYYGYNYLYPVEKKAEDSKGVDANQAEARVEKKVLKEKETFNETMDRERDEYEKAMIKKWHERENNISIQNQRDLERAVDKAMFEEYL